MSVRVTTDFAGVYKKIDRKKKRTKQILTQQVVKDSNFLAPQDTGALMNSALSASNFEKGQAVWDTPYARRLYWNPQFNFSKDKNPRAQGLWFEAAKSMFIKDWVKIAESEANK